MVENLGPYVGILKGERQRGQNKRSPQPWDFKLVNCTASKPQCCGFSNSPYYFPFPLGRSLNSMPPTSARTPENGVNVTNIAGDYYDTSTSYVITNVNIVNGKPPLDRECCQVNLGIGYSAWRLDIVRHSMQVSWNK